MEANMQTKMEVKDILRTLREKKNLTQEALAEKVLVTRQAVSRWENGETQPNTETLKLLSREYGVTINTLLGSPRQLFCQCCGMPLYEDGVVSREVNGDFNEDYCKWCYADGEFAYDSLDSLIAFLVPHMSGQLQKTPEETRTYLEAQLPKLKHWQRG